jgi:MFS family permease
MADAAFRYYGSLYYEVERGLELVQVGVMALPATLTMVAAVTIAGYIIRRTGTYGWANRLGWAFTTMGFGLLLLLHRHSSVVQMIFITFFSGLGLGLDIPGLSMTIQRAIHPSNKAHATTMNFVMRSTGQCLGVAIGGAIFSNSVTSRLDKLQSLEKINVNQLYRFIDTWRSDDGKVGPVIDAVTESLRHVWIFGCILAGLIFVLMSPIRYKRLPDFPPEGAEQEKEGELS